MISKLATLEDFDAYYELRCEEHNISWTGYTEKPNRERLQAWFIDNIKKQGRYFILFFEDEACTMIIGYLYMDIVGEKGDAIDVGYGVHSKKLRKGYGPNVIRFALNYARESLLFVNYFQAWIAADNLASIKAVLKNGCYKTNETKEVMFGNGEMKTFEKYMYDIHR